MRVDHGWQAISASIKRVRGRSSGFFAHAISRTPPTAFSMNIPENNSMLATIFAPLGARSVSHPRPPEPPFLHPEPTGPDDPLSWLWLHLWQGMGTRCSYYGVDYLPDQINHILDGRVACPLHASSYLTPPMALVFGIAILGALWATILAARILSLEAPPPPELYVSKYAPSWLSILPCWLACFTIYSYSRAHDLWLAPSVVDVSVVGICAVASGTALLAAGRWQLRRSARRAQLLGSNRDGGKPPLGVYHVVCGLIVLSQAVLFWGFTSWFFAVSLSLLLLALTLLTLLTWPRVRRVARCGLPSSLKLRKHL